MRFDAVRLWKSECVVVSDQDCILRYARKHKLPVYDFARQLPVPDNRS